MIKVIKKSEQTTKPAKTETARKVPNAAKNSWLRESLANIQAAKRNETARFFGQLTIN